MSFVCIYEKSEVWNVSLLSSAIFMSNDSNDHPSLISPFLGRIL